MCWMSKQLSSTGAPTIETSLLKTQKTENDVVKSLKSDQPRGKKS